MNDVIVVGAGPAGSTAARILAQSGFDVTVFDREFFPRVKPCGGGLTTRALSLLPPGYSDYIHAQPTEWIFEGRGTESSRSVHTERPYSHIVHRASFDQWLASQAERAGARIHTGEAVVAIQEHTDSSGYQVRTSHGTYHARYLIGADGGRGISARLLGLSRPKNGAALEAEIAVAPEIYEQWKNSVTISIAHYPWGYAWVIPRRPVLNVGVGSFRAARLPLRALLQDWIHQKLGAQATPIEILAHPLPYRHHFATLTKPRALLVGDAAGLMDTLSAEGIYSALLSATLSAKAIRDAAENDSPLHLYDQKLKQTLWPELSSAAKIGWLFYPFPGFWSKLFLENPSIIEQYLKVAQGTAPYSALLQSGRNVFFRHAHLRPRIDRADLSD